jgi:hypothetical protein
MPAHSASESVGFSFCGLLTRLPARWVAFAVEARDYNSPMPLHLEEYAIWEAVHSRTANVGVYNRKLQGMLRERLNGFFDRGSKTLCKLGTNIGIP